MWNRFSGGVCCLFILMQAIAATGAPPMTLRTLLREKDQNRKYLILRPSQIAEPKLSRIPEDAPLETTIPPRIAIFNCPDRRCEGVANKGSIPIGQGQSREFIKCGRCGASAFLGDNFFYAANGECFRMDKRWR